MPNNKKYLIKNLTEKINAEADHPDGPDDDVSQTKQQKKDGNWLAGLFGAIITVVLFVAAVFLLFCIFPPFGHWISEIFVEKLDIIFFKYCEQTLIVYIDGSYKQGAGAGFACHAGNNHPMNMSLPLTCLLQNLDSTKVEGYGVHFFLHALFLSPFYRGQLVVIRTDCQATLNALNASISGKRKQMQDFYANLLTCTQHYREVRFEKVVAHSDDERLNLVDSKARAEYGLLENERKRKKETTLETSGKAKRSNPKGIFIRGKLSAQKWIQYQHQTDFIELLKSVYMHNLCLLSLVYDKTYST